VFLLFTNSCQANVVLVKNRRSDVRTSCT